MARSKQTSQQAVAMLLFRLGGATKMSRPSCFAGILLSIVHFLLELLGLLLIHEAQPSDAFFQFECMKKGPVLVICPGIKNLLVPYDAAIRRLHGYYC
jgi:hypothetical protein